VQNTNQGAAVIDRKGRYLMTIEILAYPTCVRGPKGGFPSEYCRAVWYGKTRTVGLLNGEKILKIRLFVFTWSTNVTDTQVHRHRMTSKGVL